MKTLSFMVLLALAGAAEAQPVTSADTTVILGEYDILVTYPDIVIQTLAKLFGLEPKKAFIEERWPDNGMFSIRAWDDDGKIWLEFSADTSNPQSFVDPPLEARRFLGTTAVRFTTNLRYLFGDSTRSWVGGEFDFGEKRYRGVGYRHADPTVFGAYVEDEAGNRYISGVVSVDRKDHSLIYPYIFARFHKRDIRVEIFLRSVTITRKIEIGISE